MNLFITIIITLILLIISLLKDKEKTKKALKLALNKFINILLPLILVLIIISIIFFILPENIISKYLSNGNRFLDISIASLIGSISVMPGFVAFPLSGILKQQGVAYIVISTFTTTLMMVGILTFPVEQKYLGFKVTLIRNISSFVIAIIIALITGICFGEIL